MNTTDATIPTTPDEGVLAEIDSALAADRSTQAPGLDPARVAANAKEEHVAHSLSKILRFIGAIVIIVASATFLLQRWEGADHIMRYYSFLGFTALLSLTGFMCGLKIHEDKGARTFLGIAAALIPINFCALGGLGYSRVLAHAGRDLHYNLITRWVAPTDEAALTATLLAFAVMALLSFISFSALLRSERGRLTGLFMLANSTLLIPSRDAGIMAMLAVVLFTALTQYDYFILRKAPGAQTREGSIVRAIIAMPFLAILTRALLVYLFNLSALFAAALFAMLALTLFTYLPAYLKSAAAKKVSQSFSLVPAMVAWGCFAAQFVEPIAVATAAQFSFYTLPIAALFTLMSLYCEQSLAPRLRKASALFAIASISLCLIAFPGAVAAFLCITVSLVLITYGYLIENSTILISGIAGFTFGIAYHLRYAMDLYSYCPWVCLAALGVSTVVASSLIERHYQKMLASLRGFHGKIKTWE